MFVDLHLSHALPFLPSGCFHEKWLGRGGWRVGDDLNDLAFAYTVGCRPLIYFALY